MLVHIKGTGCRLVPSPTQVLHSTTPNMKAALIILHFFAFMAFYNAMSSAEKVSDIADVLRQLGMSSAEVVSKEDHDETYTDGGDDGDDDDVVATAMTSALLSSILDGDESGDSLLATMMEGNEKDAMIQLRFIKRLWGRIKKSRLGKFVGSRLKQRFCRP